MHLLITYVSEGGSGNLYYSLWAILLGPWLRTGSQHITNYLMFNVWPNSSRTKSGGWTWVLLTDDRMTSHGSGSIDTGTVHQNQKKSSTFLPERKIHELRFQTITASFLSVKKYKVGSRPCCKFISYPFPSLTYPATLTSGLYLFQTQNQTCTLVQLPSSFSPSPSSPLRPHSAEVLHLQAHAILKASCAVIPPKQCVFTVNQRDH